MSRNIAYRTDAIGDFYRTHRRRWQDFYDSERHVFETLAARGASFADVLDVGCAAGGLCDALSERFGPVKTYTGIDINRHAAEIGAELAANEPNRTFVVGDICEAAELAGRTFDLVTVLGVADWNVDTAGIIAKCWEHVGSNGHLVISLRLTPGETVCDLTKSYQYIWFEPTQPSADVERAPYSVLNVAEAIQWLTGKTPRPQHLYAYGFWGKPSAAARTPFERVLFSVIALRKASGAVAKTEIELHLPPDALAGTPTADRS
jgi:SAM-dependent methyltransferase